jgi:tetratricopeptide (TPR) repeat protein
LLYAASVAAFALATLAKGMTLTLPVVLLACAWWQRGRIQRRDLLRVVPFLLIGLAMAAVEVWQQHLSAGHADVRSDGLLSRTAVAGCAVWFYFWKLIWPVNLMFVYPRWNLAAVGPLWFLPGLLLAAITAWAWWSCAAGTLRVPLAGGRHTERARYGRPVLMLIVCYGALLLPVLGFVNIYFMDFSLVADHWQYAATIVPCAALAAAVAVGCVKRTSPAGGASTPPAKSVGCVKRTSPAGGASTPPAKNAGSASGAFHAPYSLLCSLALLTTLGVLTWRQSRMYANAEVLYRTTIDRNPDCWMVRNNLGVLLAQSADGIGEAIGQYQKALELNPNYAHARNNLGVAYMRCGRFDKAEPEFRKALKIDPDYAEAHNNLGFVVARRGQIDEAIGHYERALKIEPRYAEAHWNLGRALASQGRFDEAIVHFRQALALASLEHKAALAADSQARIQACQLGIRDAGA